MAAFPSRYHSIEFPAFFVWVVEPELGPGRLCAHGVEIASALQRVLLVVSQFSTRKYAEEGSRAD